MRSCLCLVSSLWPMVLVVAATKQSWDLLEIISVSSGEDRGVVDYFTWAWLVQSEHNHITDYKRVCRLMQSVYFEFYFYLFFSEMWNCRHTSGTNLVHVDSTQTRCGPDQGRHYVAAWGGCLNWDCHLSTINRAAPLFCILIIFILNHIHMFERTKSFITSWIIGPKYQ